MSTNPNEQIVNYPDILIDVSSRARDYLNSLPNRSVFPAREAIEALAQFDEPLPMKGAGLETTIDTLDRIGSPATVATAGARYFGFVIGGSFPVALASNWLATAWDQCAGAVAMSPVAAKIEAVAAKWVCDLLGIPQPAAVGFTTGSTTAHVASLLAARRNRYAKLSWNVDDFGLAGAPPISIVATADLHASVSKALGIIGFGRKNIRLVPVDDQGKMDIQKIGPVEKGSIIIGQAGNVNSGAFDPIEEIAMIARDNDAWFHVDGAFGALARTSARYHHLVSGLEYADSIACSAHKLFNVPYDSALAICRHPLDLGGALSIETSYAVKSQEREPNHFTLEGSRRARGIDIWAVLKSLGTQGFADCIERCCANAKNFARLLQAGGVRIINEVAFNQVLMDFGEKPTRDRILAAIQAEGTCWIGPAQWRGKPVARASFVNWSTTQADVKASADAILAAYRCAEN
jgi:glutamate/tyrosine decarboxylase-like PLP-dependent enzyme